MVAASKVSNLIIFLAWLVFRHVSNCHSLIINKEHKEGPLWCSVLFIYNILMMEYPEMQLLHDNTLKIYFAISGKKAISLKGKQNKHGLKKRVWLKNKYDLQISTIVCMIVNGHANCYHNLFKNVTYERLEIDWLSISKTTSELLVKN